MPNFAIHRHAIVRSLDSFLYLLIFCNKKRALNYFSELDVFFIIFLKLPNNNLLSVTFCVTLSKHYESKNPQALDFTELTDYSLAACRGIEPESQSVKSLLIGENILSVAVTFVTFLLLQTHLIVFLYLVQLLYYGTNNELLLL